MVDSASSIPAVELSDGTVVSQEDFDYVLRWIRALYFEQPSVFTTLVLCSRPWSEIKPAGTHRRTLVGYGLADAQSGYILPKVQSIVEHVTSTPSRIELRPEYR